MVWVHDLNPILLKIGALEIRWYGVMYVLAFLLTYWYCRTRIRKGKLDLTEDELDWFLLWLVAGMILGARVFEVFVWNWEYYQQYPGEIVKIWHGGLSFHGALLGMAIAAFAFCRKKGKSFLHLADAIIVPASLGNALGRIGNFINGELYGRLTDAPWGVVFPGVEGARHPSQLYEAFYNAVIFAILWLAKDRKLPRGFLFGLWLALYAVARFITEFFREPDKMVGFLTLGQFLNVFVFAAGLGLLFWLKKRA
jgi:phosphatidylglycerol:prolipoprotein diacylglycerol transferase